MAGETVAQAVQDIADHRPRRRGHHPDHLGQKRDRALAPFVKQPLGGEFLAPRLQHRHQRPRACGGHILDDQLILRLAGKGGHAALGDHLHPLLGAHLHPGHLPFPADRGNHAAIILEVEIQMPRRGPRHAPDLSAHAHQPKLPLDDALHRARQFRDGEFRGIPRPIARGAIFEHIGHGPACL